MMGQMGQSRGIGRALVLAGASFLAVACVYLLAIALFAQPAFGEGGSSEALAEQQGEEASSAQGMGAQAEGDQEDLSSSTSDGEDGSSDSSGSSESAGSDGADGSSESSASGASAGEAPSSSASPSSGSSASSGSSSSSSASSALDPKNLKDGTYTVSVKLVQASNTANGSMAGAAFDGTHNLRVSDGQYKLALAVGTVKVGTIVGYVKQLDYYPSYSISGKQVKVSGNPITCWTASKAGDSGPANVPVLDNAKDQGYVPVKLYSDEMGGSQNAVLKIDWSSVKVGKLDDSSEPVDSDVDRTKLKASITAAAAALNKGGKTAAATKALQSALDAAKKVNANAQATQAEVDGAQAALDKAIVAFNVSKDENAGSTTKKSSASSTKKSASKSKKSTSNKGFQVGHVYAVPMSFTKAGTSDTSMANQYFGSTAYVRPLKNGKFDVRFSTNRSDYVTSISYNGSKLATTSSSGNTAEYKMTVNSTKSDATYRMSLDIKPMRELGGGPAEADLHLRLSQATDKGQDTGQISSSSNNGGSSSGSASGSTRAVSAQSTGDGESFEVGQTYTVPAEFTKAGSTEKSMADQYFEHTAEVKPVDGGKYEVTITTNRSDYISEIKYDGKALSGGAEDGKKRSYTMTVPSSKSDAVYTLNMTVKPMQELGGGPADADLHLKYSQAVNKSTGRPVSASSTPQTGDSGRLIAVALACMAVSAGLVLIAGRRQSRA